MVNTPWGQGVLSAPPISAEVWQGQAEAMLRDTVTILKAEGEIAIQVVGPQIVITGIIRGVRIAMAVRTVAEARRAAAVLRAATAAEKLAAFRPSERAIIAEARAILASPEMAALRTAAAEGRAASIRVGGRVIQYEPG
ncbi:MAG: hypothetical protein ACREH8_01375, partial [Opitutaceae bacterium]